MAELTRNMMIDHVVKYFKTIGNLPDRKKNEDESKLRAEMTNFFAPDCITRMCTNEAARLFTREDWINLLFSDCSGDKYIIMNNQHPYFWSVDEEKKVISGIIREQIFDAKTGKLKADYITANFMGFTMIEGQSKYIWKLIVFMKDAPFQVETLDGYTPNQPWFDLLPE